MSIAATIAKKGKTIRWRKMAKSGGVYNPATSRVSNTSTEVKDIKAVIDGFISVVSKLQADYFVKNTLIQAGQLDLLTVERLRTGDILTIDDVDYTVMYAKSIWKKSSAVCYSVRVEQ